MDIELLYKKVKGTLADEEERCFRLWMEENPRHRQYFESFERHYYEGKKYFLTKEMQEISRKRFLEEVKSHSLRRRFRRYVISFGRVAAIFVLVGLLMHRLFMPNAPELLNLQEDVMAQAEEKVTAYKLVEQTNYGVTLINGDGENISYEQLGAWSKSKGMQLNKEGDLLSYVPEGEGSLVSEVEQYNELVVGKGAEFSIMLSDGTQVWLNADSRLKFPVTFSKNGVRRVYLQGEAYFDVSADENHPFVVTAASTDIMVYGTEFNIHARTDDYVRTTLVSGSVSVSVEGDTCQTCLTPGQTAKVNLQNGSVTLNEDPIELYVGWKQGKYYFEEIQLKDLFAELSLWYDVDVVFTDESLEHECFSGCLSRHSSLDKILRILQETTYITSKRQEHSLFIGRGNHGDNFSF